MLLNTGSGDRYFLYLYEIIIQYEYVGKELHVVMHCFLMISHAMILD